MLCFPPPKDQSEAHETDTYHSRKVDLTMKAMLNSKERTASDWSALFARLGNDFRLLDITTPPLSELSIIEVIWEGEGGGR